jgi:hypothetical protein
MSIDLSPQVDTLADWVLSLPVTDKRNALFAAVKYRRTATDPDTFLQELLKYVPFTQGLRPLPFVIRASLLSFRDDFDGSPKVRAFSLAMPRHIGLLCENPARLDPAYTWDQMASDFRQFLVSQRATPDWIDSFAQACAMSAPVVRMLLGCLWMVRTDFLGAQFSLLAGWLRPMSVILRIPAVIDGLLAYSAANIPNFLSDLFSASLHPHISREFPSYVPDAEDGSFRRDDLVRMDAAFSAYHNALFEVVLRFYRYPPSRPVLIDWIRQSLGALHWDPYSHGQFFPPQLFARAFNLETILIRLANAESPAGFSEVDPLTPHLPCSLAPQAPPLAVRDVDPWVDPEKSALFKQFMLTLDVGEPPLDAAARDAEWAAILRAHAPTASDSSVLFFAAATAIFSASYRSFVFFQRLRADPRLSRFFTASWLLPGRLALVRGFIFEMLELLVRVGGYDHAARAFRTRYPPLPYQKLPEFMAEVPFQLLRLFYIYERFHIPPEIVGRQLALTGHLFASRFYIKNPGSRRAFVETLRLVAKVPPHSHMLVMETLLAEAFGSAIQLYAAAENTGSATQYYESASIRRACIQLMLVWFQYPAPTQYLLKNLKTPSVETFLTSIASDAMTQLEHFKMGFSAGEEFDAEHPELRPEERVTAHEQIAKEFEQLGRALKLQVRFIVVLTQIAPRAFIEVQTVKVLPDVLTWAFTLLITDPKVGNPRLWPAKVPFEQFVTDLLSILLGIGFAPEISEFFLWLKEPTPPDLFDRVIALAQRLRPPANAGQQWNSIVRNLQKFREHLQELEKETVPEPEEIPDEFQDPCTCELMRNPVKLPKIGDNPQTKVDSSTLPRLKGSWSGVPFNPEDVEEDVELKARIDAWWTAYVDEYRRTRQREGQ